MWIGEVAMKVWMRAAFAGLTASPARRISVSVARASAHGDEPFELEYRIVRADGEVRWVLDRGQVVSGPGHRLWLDGAMFDITERKSAEEAALRHEVEAARTAELRASRARIIDAAEWAVVEAGVKQRVVALERFLADVYGPSEILADGVVPRRLVASSSHYHRCVAGFDPVGGVPDLPGERCLEPTFGLPALWIEEARREDALARGC